MILLVGSIMIFKSPPGFSLITATVMAANRKFKAIPQSARAKLGRKLSIGQKKLKKFPDYHCIFARTDCIRQKNFGQSLKVFTRPKSRDYNMMYICSMQKIGVKLRYVGWW